MRNTRISLLAALLAAAVMALTASTAFAAELVTESTGVHCSAITENDAPATPEVAGGCPSRGTATDFELGGAFGVMVVCDITGEGKANEAGAGVGTWAITSCETGSVAPCTGAADAHVSNSAATGAGPWAFTLNFCAVAFGLTNRCVGVAGTATEGAAHTYSASFNHINKCANGVNSMQGTFNAIYDAAHPKMEVR